MSTKKKLFSPEQRKAVEDRFGDDLLYRALKDTSLGIIRQTMKDFYLAPSEFFSLMFYAIDTLRRIDDFRLREVFCSHDLWYELQTYLLDNQEVEYAADVDACCAAICWMSAELLKLAGTPSAATDCLGLQDSANRAELLRGFDFCTEFNLIFERADKDQLVKYMKDYLSRDVFYSDEIYKMLSALPSDAASASFAFAPIGFASPLASSSSAASASPFASSSEPVVSESSSLQVSNIRIAKRKKSAVLVVFNAMFKAGFFVDENGKPLTNRDDALNKLMHFAFCEEPTKGICQLLNPSNNCNAAEKNRKLLNQLLDEKEMADYFSELRERLLATLK